MRYAAFLVHNLMYLTACVVIVSGFLMMNREIDMFGLFYLPVVITDLQLRGWISFSHTWGCCVLALLLVVHVAAVIKHQLAGKLILKGMFPKPFHVSTHQ